MIINQRYTHTQNAASGDDDDDDDEQMVIIIIHKLVADLDS